MKSVQSKLVFGAALILAQAAIVAWASSLGAFDAGTASFNDPLLLLFPLAFTMVYALVSKCSVSSFVFGLSSWLVFPLAFLVVHRTEPPAAALLIFLAMGVFYGLVGAVSSIRMSEVKGV
ncbi:MAG: hypothetical protein JTT11_07800 [Candidatus Brockarchaeota archaeon]|nr:hypothetical protein [Candidatus Brockarchaeota archaeon]